SIASQRRRGTKSSGPARTGSADRRGRRLEPACRLGVEKGRQLLANAAVIAVDPRKLLGRKEPGLDERTVDRRQRQRLEAEHLPLGARKLDRLDQQEVLDPDAVGARLVVAGLVRDDHAR